MRRRPLLALFALLVTAGALLAGGPAGAAPAPAPAGSAAPAVPGAHERVAQSDPGDDPDGDGATDDEPVPGGDIIPQPNSGTEPSEAGDRGGALQLTVFVVMLAGIGLIVALVVRESRRARRARDARNAGATATDAADQTSGAYSSQPR